MNPALVTLTDMEQAIEVWRHPEDSLPSDIVRHWHESECVLLAYACQQRCRFIPEAMAIIAPLGTMLDRSHAEAFLKQIRGEENCNDAKEFPWRVRQCLNLLTGMFHVIQAAAILAEGEANLSQTPFPQHMETALRAYKKAWAFQSPKLEVPSAFLGQPSSRSRQQLLPRLPELPRHISLSALLMVQRVLSYVLGESDDDAPYREQTNIVLVDRVMSRGDVLPLTVSVENAGYQHFYVDPVASGLTILGRELIGSVNRAWSAVKSDKENWALKPGQAIRVTPEIHCSSRCPGLPEIDGPSAGGVFACALAAAARGDALDSKAAASVALKLDQNANGYAQIQLTGVDVETFEWKVEAINDPKRGLEYFAYFTDQEGVDSHDYCVSKHPVSDLGALYKVLTGNAAIERVLKRLAEQHEKDWQEERRSVDSEHALLYYVPPHIGWSKPKRNSLEHEYVRIQGYTENERLKTLMGLGTRFRITEDPGVGKSVFTKRLQAFLSSREGWRLFERKPPLVVLWEETDGAWPETRFVTALESAVTEACDGEPCTPKEVVKYAMKNHRVVIILDAMDQVGDAKAIGRVLKHLRVFLSGPGKNCRVFLSGRPLIMDANFPKLHQRKDWRLVHIEEFDLQQQYRFLRGPSLEELRDLFGENWRQAVRIVTPEVDPDTIDEEDSGLCVYRLVEESKGENEDEFQEVLARRFPHFEQVEELLTVPHNLSLIRSLAQHNGGWIPDFESRADIYLRTCEVSISRALSRLSAQEHRPEDSIETVPRLQAILAAIACEMMVQDPSKPSLQGSEAIKTLREAAGRRVAWGQISDLDWRLLQQVTPITRRGIMREWEKGELCWHHPRMMQFYCGLHLARNGQAGWDKEKWQPTGDDEFELESVACGDMRTDPEARSVRDHAADPQWEEAFRFAMEIPGAARQDKTLRASLSLLFEPPRKRLGYVRPSQLIWEAWQLFEPKDGSRPVLGGAEVIRRQFQRPYQDLLLGKGSAEQQRIAQAFEVGFKPCPKLASGLPQQEFYRFTMGTPSTEGDESPVEVELSPFLMQQFPVTREQYALYDPQHDAEHYEDMEKFAPEPTCPVINVTWWDSFSFALYVAKTLPTEAQWEFACRAGSTTPFAFGNDLKPEQANFDGKVGRTTPQGTYPPNRWEIHDMHGNVWEWCLDRYHDKLPGGRDPVMFDRATYRVIRGGSWLFSAENCRSAFRRRFWPEYRNDYLGFRVAVAQPKATCSPGTEPAVVPSCPAGKIST